MRFSVVQVQETIEVKVRKHEVQICSEACESRRPGYVL